MLDLVNHIASSWFGERLFASTSMHALLIAQTSAFDFGGTQVLRVDLDHETGELIFSADKYQKRAPAANGFSTLEFILSERLKWLAPKIGS